MQLNKLITTEEFVAWCNHDPQAVTYFENREEIDRSLNYAQWVLHRITDYVNFMAQTVSLNMFVPCFKLELQNAETIKELSTPIILSGFDKSIINAVYAEKRTEILFDDWLYLDETMHDFATSPWSMLINKTEFLTGDKISMDKTIKVSNYKGTIGKNITDKTIRSLSNYAQDHLDIFLTDVALHKLNLFNPVE